MNKKISSSTFLLFSLFLFLSKTWGNSLPLTNSISQETGIELEEGNLTVAENIPRKELIFTEIQIWQQIMEEFEREFHEDINWENLKDGDFVTDLDYDVHSAYKSNKVEKFFQNRKKIIPNIIDRTLSEFGAPINALNQSKFKQSLISKFRSHTSQYKNSLRSYGNNLKSVWESSKGRVDTACNEFVKTQSDLMLSFYSVLEDSILDTLWDNPQYLPIAEGKVRALAGSLEKGKTLGTGIVLSYIRREAGIKIYCEFTKEEKNKILVGTNNAGNLAKELVEYTWGSLEKQGIRLSDQLASARNSALAHVVLDFAIDFIPMIMVSEMIVGAMALRALGAAYKSADSFSDAFRLLLKARRARIRRKMYFRGTVLTAPTMAYFDYYDIDEFVKGRDLRVYLEEVNALLPKKRTYFYEDVFKIESVILKKEQIYFDTKFLSRQQYEITEKLLQLNNNNISDLLITLQIMIDLGEAEILDS